jgi:flavodoxin
MILFYSPTRKTSLVAKTLAQEIKADYLEVTDLTDRKGPFNYLKSAVDALRENKTQIMPKVVDLVDYGLIYIGSPTWAGKPAPAIITLIDQCDLQGKDIVLFATMGSRGGYSVIKRMQEKIEARGARMVSNFVVKTSNKNIEELKGEVNEIITEEDLNI